MLPAILLTILAIAYRIALAIPGNANDWLPNFSPLASIALCGAAFFPKRLALLVPLSALLISDWVLNALIYHFPFWSMDIVPRYFALFLVGLLGWSLRQMEGKKWFFLLGATLVSSLFFYTVTNSASWLWNPTYSKTGAGWLQALTIGEPGYPPTWLFFRNSVVGDLFFSGLFWLCLSLPERQAAHSIVRTPIASTPPLTPR